MNLNPRGAANEADRGGRARPPKGAVLHSALMQKWRLAKVPLRSRPSNPVPRPGTVPVPALPEEEPLPKGFEGRFRALVTGANISGIGPKRLLLAVHSGRHRGCEWPRRAQRRF